MKNNYSKTGTINKFEYQRKNDKDFGNKSILSLVEM
jgi:hypothetical protein